MGLGSTAKTIQKLAERAEQLYEQIAELQQRIVNLEESVDETNERVHALEVESEKQTVLLTALARREGLDVEEILANAAIEEAEGDASEATDVAANGAGAGDRSAGAADGSRE